MLKNSIDLFILVLILASFILNFFDLKISTLLKRYINIAIALLVFLMLIYIFRLQLFVDIIFLLILVLTSILLFQLPVTLVYVLIITLLTLSFFMTLLGVDQIVSYLGALSFILFLGIVLRSFFNENNS